MTAAGILQSSAASHKHKHKLIRRGAQRLRTLQPNKLYIGRLSTKIKLPRIRCHFDPFDLEKHVRKQEEARVAATAVSAAAATGGKRNGG